MRVLPVPGLTPTVLADGQLELRSDLTGESLRCHPACTAIWIALRQHDGDCVAAAETLARAWETDIETVRSDLDAWVDLLRAAGFVRYWETAETRAPAAPVVRRTGPARRRRRPHVPPRP
ncbi:hypothetical protein V6U90_14155 [Micromonospora sp. CPCC 206060]|uniref:hypothetical protein n=1 Tax=Micromonospora sp. CPCC 206060 TaxID=3122406 RepID=UPI002FF005A3